MFWTWTGQSIAALIAWRKDEFRKEAADIPPYEIQRCHISGNFWNSGYQKIICPIRKPSGNPTNQEFFRSKVVRSHHAESSGKFVRLLWHPWRSKTICVQLDKHWHCFKGNLWETAESRGGARMGLFKRYDAIWAETKLKLQLNQDLVGKVWWWCS